MDAQGTCGEGGQAATAALGTGVEPAGANSSVETADGGGEQTKALVENPDTEEGLQPPLAVVGGLSAPEAKDSPGWRKIHSRSHSAFAGAILGVPQVSCRDEDMGLASVGLSAQSRHASASEANLQSLSSVSPDLSCNTSHRASFDVSISSYTSLSESGGVNTPTLRPPHLGSMAAGNSEDCSGSKPLDNPAVVTNGKPDVDNFGAVATVGVETSDGPALSKASEGLVDRSRATVAAVLPELPPAPTKDDVMEHVVQLKLQIVALQEENEKLKEARANMDNDLHELTANLFQEAYKMVDEAKGEKLSAEKRLADASGRIEALQTEVLALRSLLQSPAKIETPTHKTKQKSPFRKSLHFSKKGKEDKKGLLPQSSSDMLLSTTPAFTVIEHKSTPRGACIQHGEPIPADFEEFRHWIENIDLSRDNPYMAKILATDVKPCLNFTNKELSEKVLDAIEQNSLLIESIPPSSQVVSECALTGPCDKDKHCTHQITAGDSQQSCISQPCRDRIVAVCEFYVYTRHIEKKIVRLDSLSLYWQISRLRALMSLARLSLQLPEME